MLTRFHKMHGLGNDFIVFDAREAAIDMSEARARALADRHTGIGCDQLIVLRPSPAADAEMRIYNRDGGEVEACGNATRCAAQLIGGAPTRVDDWTLLGHCLVRGTTAQRATELAQDVAQQALASTRVVPATV